MSFWQGRRVLVTGHTGFKGAWAALWLSRRGADVTGLALPPESPSLFALAGVPDRICSLEVDLRDRAGVAAAVEAARPELVLHLAAQAIVRRSYADPVETFAANLMGTVHLLEGLRRCRDLKAVLIVTTDKVYANLEDGRRFGEADRLGGRDPYSASKSAAELATAAYAASYFADGPAIATARAGNVIGGGDFADDRLVPDAVRAVAAGQPLVLRNPAATRPWQHVLDCLAGYFGYLEALAGGRAVPRALNFGPDDAEPATVEALARAVMTAMGAAAAVAHQRRAEPEMQTLALDAGAAKRALGWRNKLSGGALLSWTADWYGAWIAGADMAAATEAQIAAYEALA